MTLAVIILAGGLSRRMGHDKALLQRNGMPLLRRTWEVARSLTPNVWIMTPYRDRYLACLPQTAQWIAESPPPPGAPPAGPLLAFRNALEQIDADWVLLLACDLPKLQGNVLQLWCDHLATLPVTAIAYLPQTPQGWEPLCGFYRSTCLPSLQAYAATGRRSFQGWLNQAPGVMAIPSVPPDMLINCNTPADWAAVQQP
jgi:molybdopterin-guanine dinucleotide biosynthesis protein A